MRADTGIIMKAKITSLLYGLASIALTGHALHAEDLIESYTINKNKLKVIINQEFSDKYLTDDFFAIYDEDIDLNDLDESIALLPFHMNIATIVWISGKTYEVDIMDKDAYRSLKIIKEVFRRLYPKTKWDGELVPRKLRLNKKQQARKDPSQEIALLFSGGLDSTCSSFYHFAKKQLLITCWGQWDVPLEKPKLWNARKAEFLEFAQQYGHTNSFVKSNYGSFLNHDVLTSISPEIPMWREDANEGIGMSGLAAPILVSKGYSRLYIASSFTWNYPYPSAANPFVDNNISLADGIQTRHDLFSLSRIDKLSFLSKMIRKNNLEYPRMKVCSGRQKSNCCDKCSKCLQTIIALIALGENPKNYGFDIDNEEAIEKAKRYLQNDQLYWVRWNFLCIQNKLKNMLKDGKRINGNLEWLIYTNLNQNINAKETRHKEIVYWRDFAELAPKGLTIPTVEPLLLKKQKIKNKLKEEEES